MKANGGADFSVLPPRKALNELCAFLGITDENISEVSIRASATHCAIIDVSYLGVEGEPGSDLTELIRKNDEALKRCDSKSPYQNTGD